MTNSKSALANSKNWIENKYLRNKILFSVGQNERWRFEFYNRFFATFLENRSVETSFLEWWPPATICRFVTVSCCDKWWKCVPATFYTIFRYFLLRPLREIFHSHVRLAKSATHIFPWSQAFQTFVAHWTCRIKKPILSTPNVWLINILLIHAGGWTKTQETPIDFLW